MLTTLQTHIRLHLGSSNLYMQEMSLFKSHQASQETKHQPAEHQWSHKLLTFKISRSTTPVLVKVRELKEIPCPPESWSPQRAPSCEWSARGTTPLPLTTLWHNPSFSWHPYLFFPYTQFFLNWELVNYPNTLQRK